MRFFASWSDDDVWLFQEDDLAVGWAREGRLRCGYYGQVIESVDIDVDYAQRHAIARTDDLRADGEERVADRIVAQISLADDRLDLVERCDPVASKVDDRKSRQ